MVTPYLLSIIQIDLPWSLPFKTDTGRILSTSQGGTGMFFTDIVPIAARCRVESN
jgi:hypothetical protein